jgi:nitroreductase
MHSAPERSCWEIEATEFPLGGRPREQLRHLLRYAVLAPSTKNTQPWRFRVDDWAIHVFADLRRWQKVADADQRELHVSLGCAIENLLIAAAYFEFDVFPLLFPDPQRATHVATVEFARTGVLRTPDIERLFAAMTRRMTSHKMFRSDPVPPQLLAEIAACAETPDILVFLADDDETRRRIDWLNLEADRALFASADYREEIGHWVGQGVFGTPWLLSKLGELVYTYINVGERTARLDHEVLLSAPVVGVICTRDNDRRAFVRAGQVFERVFLEATAHGLAMQPMSQTIEVVETRRALRDLVSPHHEWIPQQPFRLGFPVERPKDHTPRRSVADVMDTPG